MSRRNMSWAALVSVAALVACGDLVAPSRFGRYEWRLIVPFDSLGTPMVDTLSFHWPASRLPVRIWVEDQYGMPGLVQQGIDLWKSAFLYREYDGTIVTDSTSADVIVRTIQAPAKPSPPAIRLGAGPIAGCQGETQFDTAATRRELQLPMHVYVWPKYDPTTVDLTSCFRVVAAHELGHSLGLFDHSSDTLDIMNATPRDSVYGLSARDIRTVETVYHWPVNFQPVGP